MEENKRRYIEVKGTPLKWHRFLQIIGMPVAIIFEAYLFISMFAELMGIHSPALLSVFTPFLTLMESDVYHLGSYFWVIIVALFAPLVCLLLALVAWLGSFHWHRYSRHAWNLYLLLKVAVTGMILYLTMRFNGSEVILSYLSLFGVANHMPFLSKMGINALILLLITFMILQAVFFVFSYIYGFRRRKIYANYRKKNEEQDFWVCERCGERNVGNFCNYCGKPRYVVVEENSEPVTVETPEPEPEEPVEPEPQKQPAGIRWLLADDKKDEPEEIQEDTVTPALIEEVQPMEEEQPVEEAVIEPTADSEITEEQTKENQEDEI